MSVRTTHTINAQRLTSSCRGATGVEERGSEDDDENREEEEEEEEEEEDVEEDVENE